MTQETRILISNKSRKMSKQRLKLKKKELYSSIISEGAVQTLISQLLHSKKNNLISRKQWERRIYWSK
jgi:hypothetical protein